jgi:hypothetical protein
MSVGYTTWNTPKSTVFIIKNINTSENRIKVFNYPIGYNKERDLMKIPYISEADIRNSLLKGELYTKISQNQITVVASNIDLTQFDDVQKEFLQSAGILIGTTPPSSDNNSSGNGSSYTEQDIINIANAQIDNIPDATSSNKGLMTIDQATKVENLLTKTNYSGTIETSGSGIIATIPIQESSNVFLEVNINAHAYNGMMVFGTIQAQYQRISNKTAKEITQSLVGIWSVYPQSNLWNPNLSLNSNTISILLTPDNNYTITYNIDAISVVTDIASDGYSPIITNQYLIDLIALFGGFGFDAQNITEDVEKPGYISSVTNLADNEITITRYNNSSYDPEISETSEGYPSLTWSGNQGLVISPCPTSSVSHTLFAVIKPDAGSGNRTLFENDSLLIAQSFSLLSCDGPGIFGAGTTKSTSQELGLQILEFKIDAVDETSKIYKNGIEIGTSVYGGNVSLVSSSFVGFSTNGWYFSGQILEVWEIETNLSIEQRNQIYEYFQSKFPEIII